MMMVEIARARMSCFIKSLPKVVPIYAGPRPTTLLLGPRCEASSYPAHEVDKRVGEEPAQTNRYKSRYSAISGQQGIALYKIVLPGSQFKTTVRVIARIDPTYFVTSPEPLRGLLFGSMIQIDRRTYRPKRPRR
jgi:hypothetical protein